MKTSDSALYIAIIFNDVQCDGQADLVSAARRRAFASDMIKDRFFTTGHATPMYNDFNWTLLLASPGVDIDDFKEIAEIYGSYSIGIARQPYSACVTAMVANNLGTNMVIEYDSAMSKAIRQIIELDPGFINRNAMGASEMISEAQKTSALITPEVRFMDTSLPGLL